MTKVMIVLFIILLTLLCLAYTIYQWKRQVPTHLSSLDKIKLCFSGFVAFIADTLGLGSFAVNIALAKLLDTFEDEELPGLTNGAQVIPGAISSLFFLNIIDVDIKTLVVLILGTCIGGVIGGFTVAHINKQRLRLTMMLAFTAVLCLLFCYEFHWLSLSGDASALSGMQLFIGFFALILCGVLTSVGVGLFVSTQAVLFLMNISPLVAFPIMTAAGAMQQPLTTMTMLANNKIPIKKTMIVSFSGIAGVLVAIPIFTYLSISWLHYLLIGLITYNICSLGLAYWKNLTMIHGNAQLKLN